MAYNSLDASSDTLRQASQRLEQLARRRSERKQALSQELFHDLAQRSDRREQNLLQNVRRDLYNDRPVKSKHLRRVREILLPPLREELQRYLTLLDQQRAAETEAEVVYHREVARLRAALQPLSEHKALQQGLVLSSQDFLRRLPAYRQKPADQFTKKELRAEQTLLKYLTRMQVKTSPFSTFNNLCLGHVAPGHEARVSLSPATTDQVPGHVRLNNYLYQYLQGLFRSSRAIYTRLPVRVNPTVEHRTDHLHYLTSHNNVEAFQRLPPHPIVVCALDYVREHPAGVGFHQLHAYLLREVDATPEALEAYIKQLVDYGLLEYDLGVSGIDPDWDQKLIPRLQPLAEAKVEHVETLIAALRSLRTLAQRFGPAAAPERLTILTEAFDTFRNACWQLHEVAGLPADERLTPEARRVKQQQEIAEKEAEQKSDPSAEGEDHEKEDQPFEHQSATYFSFRPEQLFYEDTTHSTTPVVDRTALEAWVNRLQGFLSELPLFRGQQDEQFRMKHYFQEHYPGQTDVSLLTFYEDYYRDVKKPEAERAAQAQEPPESPPAPPSKGDTTEQPEALRQHRALMKQWQERLKEQLPAADETGTVHLSSKMLQAVNRELGVATEAAPSASYGSFVQFYTERTDEGPPVLRGVVNGIFPGYGKMLSRFLHIFDASVTQEVRSWNQAIMDEDVLFIEDCDGSYFNANLHPPLLPYEVRMPGGHNSLPADRQLPITDFEVRCLPEQSELILVHRPTGQRTYPLDLGFQGHRGRSQLFQLLEKFTHARYHSPHPVTEVINATAYEGPPTTAPPSSSTEEVSPAPTVVVRPRIVWEQQVVLQRKSWLVPLTHLPVRDAQSSDAAYFYQIRAWQQRWGIPDEVFVCVNPFRGHQPSPVADNERTRKLRRDDYKPQFINLANPLLVLLFEKLAERVPYHLEVTEMLPGRSQMLTQHQERYVTEWVVQWYSAAPVSQPSQPTHCAYEVR